jgi:hypothetical protein
VAIVKQKRRAVMTIYADNLAITRITTSVHYWDQKRKKRVKYKKPKVVRQEVYRGEPYDLTDTLREILFAVDRQYDTGGGHGKVQLEIKFNVEKSVF